MSKALCLIPAKGNSVRLPRKNVLPLNGKPMIANVINKALLTSIFDEVIVSTEDEEIANISTKAGANVPFKRPVTLSKDPSTLIDVVLHTLEYYQDKEVSFDKVCILLSTSPFVTVNDILLANELFDKNAGCSVLSVSPTEFPPFNSWVIDTDQDMEILKPCFPDSPYKFTKSTECPSTYRSNGAILIANVENLIKERTYRTLPIIPFIMPYERSLDIDTSFDYEFAKFLINSEYYKNQVKEA